MSRTKKTLKVIVITAFILVGVLYLFLPLITAQVVKAILKDQGFAQISVKAGYPGTRQGRISHLGFEFYDSGKRYSLLLKDIRLSYHLETLWRGRIESLKVGAGRLDVEPTTLTMPTRAARLPWAGPWVTDIPVAKLSLKEFQVYYSYPKTEQADMVLSVDVQRQVDSLQVLVRQEPAGHQLKAMFQATGQMRLELYENRKATQAVWVADLLSTPREKDRVALTGELLFRLGGLGRVISTWVKDVPGMGWSGTVAVKFNASLPQILEGQSDDFIHDVRLNTEWELNASAAQLFNAGKQLAIKGHVGLSLERGAIQFVADKGLVVSGQFELPSVNPSGSSSVSATGIQKQTSLETTHRVVGNVREVDGQYNLDLLETAALKIRDVLLDEVFVPTVNLQLIDKAVVRYSPADDAWRGGRFAIAVRVPRLVPNLAEMGSIDDLTFKARVILPQNEAGLVAILDDVAWTQLGGRLSIKQYRYQDGYPSPPYTIDIQHLDLAKLVKLQPQFGMEASGYLDGQLPIITTRQGVTINGGRLRARPPGGVIRLQPPEGGAKRLGASSLGLEISYKIFENYRYDSLTAAIKMSADGTANTFAHVKGRNPDAKEYPPIELNLNLENNVFDLVRSMNYVANLTDYLEGAVRQYYSSKERKSE
ncbi:MAG TPA: hypothetical protein ENI80_03690 [Acidiferrobacteraceae bacterium]|nr:hypothetical protein [Acidiferrobacteraceae bacterium]